MCPWISNRDIWLAIESLAILRPPENVPEPKQGD